MSLREDRVGERDEGSSQGNFDRDTEGFNSFLQRKEVLPSCQKASFTSSI
jgi:hypothetical protein